MNGYNSCFICNGFHIPQTERDDHEYELFLQQFEERGYFDGISFISVIDRNGILPLDLLRKTVRGSFRVEESLIVELCKFSIAKHLCEANAAETALYEDENFVKVPCSQNIMLKVLQEYLPHEAITTTEGPFAGEINGGNNGQIPNDMMERKRIYPKAFRELARYMK